MSVQEIKAELGAIVAAMQEMRRRLRDTPEGQPVDMTGFADCPSPQLDAAAELLGVMYVVQLPLDFGVAND